MTYAEQQLKDSMNAVLQESNARQSMLDYRISKLEAFMIKAEPYINVMVLIDTGRNKEGQ